MIVVINYQMGNLQSVVNGFEALGEKAKVTDNPRDLKTADGIVIPGVGAFGAGMENLKKFGFIPFLNEEVLSKKKPFLGICLGMQLLAKKSFENGEYSGLGWLDFEVKRINPSSDKFRVPHMGWNELSIKNKESRLFRGIVQPAVVYFVHSFHLFPEPFNAQYITSTCFHGQEITASIEKENIFAVQFHPEKSQNTGLALLKNFINIVKGDL